VSARARHEPGFTLTEILMAVGILGVGLTMVASIFPVAVDQSRRSRESTMAAMCARSAVAMMKARRDKVVPWCRTNAKDKTDEMSRVANTATLASGCIPGKFRVYNPDSFLYDDYDVANQNRRRSYSTTDNIAPITIPDANGLDKYPTWMAGNYVPVVFASPIAPIGTTPLTGLLGPWRVTIVVYRAGGNYGTIAGPPPTSRWMPEWLDPKNIPPADNPQYLAAWKDATATSPVRYPARGTAGDYVLDFRKSDTTNARGEAYLVDRVITGATAANDTISLAAKVTATGINAEQPVATLTNWVSMPKAVAVFHTVIGE
jgi:prepilin-type N-terminal cleavage/methylation domain-containing protein